MHFENNHLYHIFNQGNNHQRIFFSDENYLFFIEKMRVHLLPYCDILAWCLLPNHFHLMTKVNQVELPVATDTHGVTLSHPVSRNRTLNDSIAIMLRSYTRAINKQEQRSGALFRESTKAECLDCSKGITPSFYNSRMGTQIHIHNPEKSYPQVCFNYIHQNPVKAHLVNRDENWPWSSYRDVTGLRNGTLINRELIKELDLLTYSSDDSKSSDE
ncbi:MAG TPA: transposase [Marinilabiliales bacterium]|nr:MAG: hypothetical protein A2W84_16900 [Bacteroidetes bacterium GWC2_40_13]OFX74338.1 MAG: hypothetical protein A2W96_13515 [Bacteroidetes bacterium GWD2_40_43]OFX90927.1 MAG: hypothetical protein A2W97_07845 [Bacteroidetes bacterium GWE2_40_63]OFY21141.1 MAG: hypothetical protein A2W88_18820 [Bacteroidetes bacterium GWF2_40_13]OFZ25380.1 MAG: hypothetical protein A2437_01480 [Bacteroidetes bacterium RIFOXYC2_FULL_40_12]HAM98810.1 transposase [Marinilabiliales bacterium]